MAVVEVDVGAQLFTTLALMFGGALLAGAAPFFFRVRESSLQALAALGAGLLIGSALAVIIPEGFHAFAQVSGHAYHDEVHDHDHDPGHTEHDHEHEEAGLPEGVAGLVLVAGFLAMLLLDHAQHAAGGSCGHTHGHGHSHAGHSHGVVGSASQERLLLEKEKGKGKAGGGGKQASGAADAGGAGSGGGSASQSPKKGADGEGKASQKADTTGKAKAPAPGTDPSSAITGLLIHCCADGLAMGAAFLSGNARLTMIIAAAMVLHKAPMAFGLSTYLMSCGWNFARSQRTLLAFAAAAPAATLATYGLLGSLTFLSSPGAVALCVIFSGGTFLHAATMHILPEVLSSGGNGRMGSMQLAAVAVGSLLPAALSWGHHH